MTDAPDNPSVGLLTRVERLIGSNSLSALLFGMIMVQTGIGWIGAVASFVVFANYSIKVDQIHKMLAARKAKP